MSEEKLYAVKNDKGKYWDFSEKVNGFWSFSNVDVPVTLDKGLATEVARNSGGHVVAFVEEPEKVTVSPNEAKAIESLLNANAYIETLYPFRYLFTSRNKEDIKRLIKAIKNGYTVAKEKKYNVKVPHTDDSYFYKIDHETCNATDSFHIDLDRPEAKFTKLEIDHYHLQEYKKEEVNDDDE